MLKNPYLVGVMAGGAVTILYLSVATLSPIGILLFYLAPLPGLIAGFGWGLRAALVAGLTGALLTLIVLGPTGGLSYILMLAVPTAILTHYAFLFRVTGQVEPDETPGAEQIEWYPVGNLVLITALYGGSLAVLTLLTLGPTYEAYSNRFDQQFGLLLKLMREAQVVREVGEADVDKMKEMLKAVLPAFTAIVWTLFTLLNLWLAGVITRMSGILRRPWPDIAAMRFPPLMTLVMFGLFLLASAFSGMPGLIVSGYLGALSIAFLVLGLAIVHYLSRGNKLRTMILFGTYVATIIIGWGALILTVAGIVEPLLDLRKLNRKKDDGSS